MAGRNTVSFSLARDRVLVIGGSEELIGAVRFAANAIDDRIMVHRCDLLSAATETASFRPTAIVMDAAVFGFDPVELEALARDVGARLLLVDDDAQVGRDGVAAIRARLEAIFAA